MKSLQVWLRVELGFHTTEQVVVGAALGGTLATLWHRAAVTWVLPACERSAGARYTVLAIFLALFGIFMVKLIDNALSQNGKLPVGRDASLDGKMGKPAST